MAVTVQDLGPEFGYAVDARPLPNERDWGAEQIRIVLRSAGFRDSTAETELVVDGENPCLVGPRRR